MAEGQTFKRICFNDTFQDTIVPHYLVSGTFLVSPDPEFYFTVFYFKVSRWIQSKMKYMKYRSMSSSKAACSGNDVSALLACLVGSSAF